MDDGFKEKFQKKENITFDIGMSLVIVESFLLLKNKKSTYPSIFVPSSLLSI